MKGVFSRIRQFNSSRYRLWLVNERFAASIPAGAMVLDAGAGDAPYRPLLQRATYESADFEAVDKDYAKTTYVCDLREIPVADQRYDFVLFNQVMEHVPDPRAVLTELFRVLKPGGKLIYTGPFFYEEHEQPYDFFRYTQFGVRQLFTEAGFAFEQLDWLEGYFGTVGYQMNCMARYLPTRPADIVPGMLGLLMSPALVLLKAQLVLCSIVFHKLETKKKYTARGYPKNYVAILVRPAS
jgi:SAM-dependent methyltransferase